MPPVSSVPSRCVSGADCGLAQASHAARSMSPSEFATRKVMSVEVMDSKFLDIEVVDRRALSPQWIAILRPKSLEDHLVGEARCALPVVHAAHRPGQQRHTKNMARRERQRGGQILHRVGDELRMRSQHILAIGEGAVSPRYHLLPSEMAGTRP